MQIISKVLIGGLVVATSISAAIVASSMGNAAATAPHTAPSAQNYTIIHKTNGTWPLKGMVSVEPCSLRACVDA